jgi:biotin carboxylase
MRRLGDKVEAKLLAEATGVPVAPWSGGPVLDVEDGRKHAATIGYPLIVKARSGGGGRGIRIVRAEHELDEALERTQSEALRAFADPVVFMERLVEGGRHIEVQVIADAHGGVWAPGVRDCSIQRRNQKLIEESSSPALRPSRTPTCARRPRRSCRPPATSAPARSSSCTSPTRSCSPSSRSTPACRSSTRSPRRRPGLDLVKLQLHVADGGAWSASRRRSTATRSRRA